MFVNANKQVQTLYIEKQASNKNIYFFLEKSGQMAITKRWKLIFND